MTSLSPANTLIVIALEAEAQHLFEEFKPLYCGVGKVNAAYRLTRRLAEWHAAHGSMPKLVLNLGSAGSAKFNAGSVVNCTSFVQRDFDVTALGIDAYVTPFENVPAVLKYGERYADYDEAVCGTGDSFVTTSVMTSWNVVDMEAYAMAKICMLEKISFGCLKYITDGANGHAATSWEEGLPATAKSLHAAMNSIGG